MDENSSSSSKRGRGNTQPSPAKLWCFTLNNYSESDIASVIKVVSSNSSNKWIIGREVGESGTPHLQGFIHFTKKLRFTQVKKIHNQAHWTKCRGTEIENVAYCSKDGDYISSPNLHVPKPLKLIQDLYPWQQEIVDIVKTEPDDRSIYWFWEPTGNIGKTQLCKYLSAIYGAILVEGKKSDILYFAALNPATTYLFDFTRSKENYISYESIEKLKNGYFFSGKFECSMVLRNPPHIIIFANYPPMESALSQDRWKIKELTGPVAAR